MIAPVGVGDGQTQYLALADRGREWSVTVDPAEDVATFEAELPVAGERARQQTELGQHLKPVADAEDGAAAGGERMDGVDDGAEAGDGSGAEVVAIGEAPRYHHRVGLQALVLVPDVIGVGTEDVADRVERVPVRVASGKSYDRDLQRVLLNTALPRVAREDTEGLRQRQRIVTRRGKPRVFARSRRP